MKLWLSFRRKGLMLSELVAHNTLFAEENSSRKPRKEKESEGKI